MLSGITVGEKNMSHSERILITKAWKIISDLFGKTLATWICSKYFMTNRQKGAHDDSKLTFCSSSILYLVKLSWLSRRSLLPLCSKKGQPKTNLIFLMFSTFTIYPKDILRKQFLQQSFSEKKKKSKKIIHFFFRFCFFEFIFFSLSKTYSTPFSFYFIVIQLLPTKKKDRKNASLDQYILI